MWPLNCSTLNMLLEMNSSIWQQSIKWDKDGKDREGEGVFFLLSDFIWFFFFFLRKRSIWHLVFIYILKSWQPKWPPLLSLEGKRSGITNIMYVHHLCVSTTYLTFFFRHNMPHMSQQSRVSLGVRVPGLHSHRAKKKLFHAAFQHWSSRSTRPVAAFRLEPHTAITQYWNALSWSKLHQI